MKLPTTNKSGYNGNPFLKKPNQALSYTDHDIQEYIKCKNDIIYFAENYMTIIGDKGPQKFTLYPYQKKMLKMFVKNKFNIVTTARQAGKCCDINTPIRVKNKSTGEVLEMTIGEFYGHTKLDANKK